MSYLRVCLFRIVGVYDLYRKISNKSPIDKGFNRLLFLIMLNKDSNKKCNGHSPHSPSGEGRAPRGLSKPPLSA